MKRLFTGFLALTVAALPSVLSVSCRSDAPPTNTPASTASDTQSSDGPDHTDAPIPTETEPDRTDWGGNQETWSALCSAQTTPEGCAAASLELPSLSEIEGCIDCGHACFFTQLAEVTAIPPLACEFGAKKGVCYYAGLFTEYSACQEPFFDVPLCGRLDALPVYLEEGDSVYLGSVCETPGGGGPLKLCQYDLESPSHPACRCPCTFQPDAALMCTNSPSVCRDDARGLMWPRTAGAMGSSGGSHCEELLWGGFDDWRLPTLGELRTLLRGCPSNEADGECALGDSCATAACAQAPCLVHPSSPLFDILGCSSFVCPNELCMPTAIFGEGPCAACVGQPGPGLSGCHLPDELAWPCEIYHSSTAVENPPEFTYGTYWGIDSLWGAPVLLGYFQKDQYVYGDGSLTACVRDI